MNKLIRYILLCFVFFAADATLIAQNADASNQLDKVSFWMLLGTSVVIIAAAFFVLLRLLISMMNKYELQAYKQQGAEPVKVATEEKATEPFISKIFKRLTSSVPIAKEKDILFDHDYDGIRELDNSLPPWWLYGFYFTIIFAFFYIGYYHVFDLGKSSHEEYEFEVKQAEDRTRLYLASLPVQVDETNVVVNTDPTALEQGQAIWKGNCVVCHLESGAGLVGPNMADNYWVHGGDIKSLFKTIKYGVLEKGMISWSSQLRPEEMQNVASYILEKIVGTNPENPKPPEGELYVPEESTDGLDADESSEL